MSHTSPANNILIKSGNPDHIFFHISVKLIDLLVIILQIYKYSNIFNNKLFNILPYL